MNRQKKYLGLQWKIGGIYTGVMVLLGIGVIAAVHHLTASALREQLDKRALAIATTLSDAAAGHMAGRNPLALHALARKYTFLEGLAYAYIEDANGNIAAHTLGTFPEELRRGVAGDSHQAARREVVVENKLAYETAVPVLEGRLGFVHVGFWADAMNGEIRSAMVPIVSVITIVPIVGALLSFFLAHRIVRPIVDLREIADKVTMGDLETSVGSACVSATDEIGDLARSLERMRSSLKAAMLRLGREVA